MAGVKAYSEIVGKFRILENFFGDRVHKNDLAYKPDLIPQNNSRAEKSA